MAIREKFGKLILLEHGEPGPLGQECRAARLGPAGLDRLVTVVRFAAAVSSSAEATKRLVEEARLAARIQSPGLARVLGIGRVEQSFYVWTELVEGKSVAAILERCRAEGFPFAADQALMIASRAAAALEPLHAKRDDAGEPLAHGLLAPSRLVVTYDGEVKIRGLGLWPGLRGTGLLPPEECLYLAPEQAAGEAGGPRSDVYALGQILLVSLAGLAPGGADPASRLAGAQLTSTTGERAPLPPPLVELLRRALDPDPAGRFAGAAALRKAIDALVFSGDLAPTTFDLAFFMNTLFREEMEREAQALEEARSASYAEFLVEERPAPAPPATEPDSAPPATEPDSAPPATEPDSAPEPPPPVPPPAAPIPTDVPLPAVAEAPRRTVPERTPTAREATAREAAARMTLGATAPADRRGLWLLLGLLGAVIVGGGAGLSYFVKLRGPAPATPTTLGASAAAAQERVRELEARIAQLEREKGEAEARAAQEARQAVEAGATAGGGTADPSAIAQAQEEARRRARAELEAQQQEELRRLADEKRAEERRLAEATPTPVLANPPTAAPVPEAVATPTPTPTPEPPPPPAPSTRPGSLVEYADPDLTRPVVVVEPKTRYPPLAEQRKLGGTVELLALVDETGAVAEVTVVTASPRGLGFEAEATRSLKGRRYRPGTKDGVAVRVWVPIIVKFGTP